MSDQRPRPGEIARPIFIIGSGRCGSTILHETFTRHPRIAFLSGLCKMYPDLPWVNRSAMHLMDIPVLKELARRRFRPAEHWEFWDHHYRGFSAPVRDLHADDVRPHNRDRIRVVLAGMLTPRRDRLLVKLTGWPRVGFLSEIFPDALFIHLIRDGRAVVNSLLDVDFWQGWKGPQGWTWGQMTPPFAQEWEQHDRSFVALAAIQWKSLMDEFEIVQARSDPSRFLSVRYEDLTEDPRSLFGQILEFCGLDYPESFRTAIDQSRIRSMNFKWESHFTAHQKEILEKCLKDHLPRYGYQPESLDLLDSRARELSNLAS